MKITKVEAAFRQLIVRVTRRAKIAALVFSLLPGAVGFAQDDSAAVGLARTENEFAACASIFGIKYAFLRYFDVTAVMFVPRPANAREILLVEPETKGKLIWHPSQVEASASGDFGYTTGPSEFIPAGPDSATPHTAHFLSVWKRSESGGWKVILDVGSRSPFVDMKAETLQIPEASIAVNRESPDTLGRELPKADSTYSQRAVEEASGEALKRFASERVLVYRQGCVPARDKRSAVHLLMSEKFKACIPGSSDIARSGDLAFTYGLALSTNADTSNYVRIWKWENGWKVKVDLVNLWPKRPQ